MNERPRPFSSSLGVSEALTLRNSGLEPLAQVMGTSYYQVGWQQMPWTQTAWRTGGSGETFELELQTHAYNEARRLAVGRLRDEARAARADAVVGVRITRRVRDWATDLVEFVAIGTAVRSTRYDLTAGGEPLLCNLTGQDVAKLVAHGFWPVGIVGGSTVAYVMTGARQRFAAGGLVSRMRNQELPDYSRGLYDARALAMARVTEQAHELQAHGVVGVDLERAERTRERDSGAGSATDLIIELHVLGTAIVEVALDRPEASTFIALPLT